MNVEKFCGTLGLSIFLLAGPLTGQAKAVILGDFDHDCDVDSTDLAHFKTCALGPTVTQIDPACADARLDADEDVDLDDFGMFQRCYSGEGNPADPSCEQPCSEGVCCPCGQTNCNGTCTSTASDEANCGACGNACAAGLVCQSASCATCPPGQEVCGGICMGFAWDNANCGACGNVCDPNGYTCVAGYCEPVDPNPAACAGGSTSCGGVCTNLAFDPWNCGGCGIVCPVTCSGGICQDGW